MSNISVVKAIEHRIEILGAIYDRLEQPGIKDQYWARIDELQSLVQRLQKEAIDELTPKS